MSVPTSPTKSTKRLPVAFVFVIFLWVGYTIIQTMAVVGVFSQGWSAALGFLPGILGVAALLSAGLTRKECYLVANPISKKGFIVLVGIFFFALSAMLPVMDWKGWSWKAALIMAPVGGITQELFFRSALLPAFRSLFKKRERLALILHSVLFGLWHIGPLFVGAPIWAVFAVMLVPFLSGIGWGWQVIRDKTVFWAMLQHSLIWVVGLQFEVAG